MILLSGSTHILFDGKYQLKEGHKGDSNGRLTIAFNQYNDLTRRPDPDYVRSLKGFFPGTLISMRFSVDNRYLSSVAA